MTARRFTFRLRPDRDEDLIAWLDSLGEGERSFFIRQALRKALNERDNLPGKVIALPKPDRSLTSPPGASETVKINNPHHEGERSGEVPEDSDEIETRLDRFASIF
jgi:hypothetical protein